MDKSIFEKVVYLDVGLVNYNLPKKSSCRNYASKTGAIGEFSVLSDLTKPHVTFCGL